MSTKVGIIAEGPIDHILLHPLLHRIAQDKAGYNWPVAPDDVSQIFPVRKRGFGGVVDTVRRLVAVLDTQYFDHAFFVILLDYHTKQARAQIARLIRGKERFVVGIAIREIEAWWLGDRKNTIVWAGFGANGNQLPSDCCYAAASYHAERDPTPKKTLDELTQASDRFDRFYGEGSVDLAREFAEDYWQPAARLDDIAAQCHRGFRPFQDQVVQEFCRAPRRNGRLF